MTLIFLLIALIALSDSCHGFISSSYRKKQGGKKVVCMSISAQKKDSKLEFGWIGKLAFSLVPLSPEAVGRRKTVFTEVVPGKIWTLDQVANHPPCDSLKHYYSVRDLT